MKRHLKVLIAAGAMTLAGASFCPGHDVVKAPSGPASAPVVPLQFAVEKKGPIKAPPPLPASDGRKRSGQGFWKFVAVEGVLPIPVEARGFVKGAHGTLLVDAERDTVYWGLEKVGWIAFSNRLKQSWIVKGDPAFASGNLHGADLLPRRGQLPLVGVADNVEGEVYLSDTSFQHADKLDWPQGGPYSAKGEFHPTDVAFTGGGGLFVTDGYGKAWFMPATAKPLRYGGAFHGGKTFSQTPHGVTYDPSDKSLLISARPEGQVKRWSVAKEGVLEVQGLPPGSTVCDVDLWRGYALAPCLDGPEKSPGPIYILHLKKKAIVSTLRPKAELGFTDARHIHDAAWYVVRDGRRTEVFVLFTNWNPGGLGALKLVNAPD